MNLLQNEANEEKSLVGYVLEVQLEPVERLPEDVFKVRLVL
jgi:hypothetical protein